jgi:hypothetical protein
LGDPTRRIEGCLCVAKKKVFLAEFFNKVLKPGALGLVASLGW